jgi:precorrin-6B C5,15-methyltransferase / cobalt-precorrin-6B C5,C15-methyltransferase
MSADPITVVGMDGAELTAAAMAALHEATLLIGADRQTWALPNGVTTVPRRPLRDTDGMLADLRDHDGPAVVLAAGDPGFFGIVRALRSGGFTPRVLPAPSSVQRLCAAIGRPWDDIAVVDATVDLRAAVNVCRARSAVAVLTGPDAGPAELGAQLHGWTRTLVVAEDLGEPGERLTTVDAGRAGSVAWQRPNLVLCLSEDDKVRLSGWYAGGEPTPPPGGWGLPPSAFSHRDGRLAAPEVRAVILARLAPRPGMLVWDVGAGPGAIAVECARMGAAVLAVERDPGQCVRIMANAASHGVEVCVIEDSAPGSLGHLPEPDAIFVGGGGPGVVAACTATGAARIVVALTALEDFADCRDILYGNGFVVDGCQLLVSRFADADGRTTRLAASSPVFLLCGTRSTATPPPAAAAPPSWPPAALPSPGQRPDPGPPSGSSRTG